MDEDRADVISPSVYLKFLWSQEEIMRDRTMLDYLLAMKQNVELFRNAVVLEVGCGSALLSMWAGRLGAARVIALESSDVAQVARQLVRENRLQNVIDVIQGNIEEIELPVDMVDIIISKWMGPCLMYNSSLDAVIYARDKWLKPGGTIFPNAARLYITAASNDSNNVAPKKFWSRFAGFNMSRAGIIQQQIPLGTCVADNQLVAERHLLKTFELSTIKPQDLSFTSAFSLRALYKAIAHMFVVYFEFDLPDKGGVKIISTSPSAPFTQFKQTVFYIDDHLPINVNNEIRGKFSVMRYLRHLDFDIHWSCKNELVNIPMHKQIFRMQNQPRPF